MHPFLNITRRLGEGLVRESGARLKASLRSSTRATYSLANRACFFEGLGERGPEVGEYLTRDSDGKAYLVETRQPEPQCQQLEYLYLALCNQRVNLARPLPGATGAGDKAPAYEIYAREVPVYMDTTTRSYKSQNDGMLDQSIYIIHLPAKLGIRKMDRVYIHRSDVPLDDQECYRVDSINDALTPIDEEVDTSGIDVIQLADDARTGGSVQVGNSNGQGSEKQGLW